MTKPPKFQYYEQVVVDVESKNLVEIAGKSGFIFGMSENTYNQFVYTVLIENDGVCWCVPEEELSSMGKIFRREDFY